MNLIYRSVFIVIINNGINYRMVNYILMSVQVQAFGMDITKEEGGQIKIAPHESAASTPQSSIEETGESTPEEATGEEGARAESGGGDTEPPISLADLLG